MLFVYILKCCDKSYYTGVTNSIERRFAEHQSGIDHACYTYNRRPLEVIFVEEFMNDLDAIAFEKQIKRWSRKKKEALIEKDWERLRELSKSKGGHGSTSSP